MRCTISPWAATARFMWPKHARSGSSSFVHGDPGALEGSFDCARPLRQNWVEPMRLGHQTRRMLTRFAGRASIVVLALCGLIAGAPSGTRIAAQIRPAPAPVPAPVPDVRTVLDTYCITCHNQRLRTGGLALDRLDVTNPGANAEVWENVIA